MRLFCLKNLYFALLTQFTGFFLALSAPAHAAQYKACDHHRFIGNVSKIVKIHFINKRKINRICGRGSVACAFVGANLIYMPEDRHYGWTGIVSKKVDINFTSQNNLPCKNNVGCLFDNKIFIKDASFTEYRSLARIGKMYSLVLGLKPNPRQSELLAHEMRHILTGINHSS
jgi:hypothetical protein